MACSLGTSWNGFWVSGLSCRSFRVLARVPLCVSLCYRLIFIYTRYLLLIASALVFFFSLGKKSETEAKEIGGRSRKLLVAAGTVSSAYLRWHRRYRKHK